MLGGSVKFKTADSKIRSAFWRVCGVGVAGRCFQGVGHLTASIKHSPFERCSDAALSQSRHVPRPALAAALHIFCRSIVGGGRHRHVSRILQWRCRLVRSRLAYDRPRYGHARPDHNPHRLSCVVCTNVFAYVCYQEARVLRVRAVCFRAVRSAARAAVERRLCGRQCGAGARVRRSGAAAQRPESIQNMQPMYCQNVFSNRLSMRFSQATQAEFCSSDREGFHHALKNMKAVFSTRYDLHP